MRRFIGTVISHHVLANVVMIIILGLGLTAALNMTRESFPTIEPRSISVTVPFPGADVEEVEEGISRKIEEAIDGIEGVERYSTISSENMGVGIVEIEDGYPMDEARSLIENAVDAISTFPAEAEKPVISEALFRRPVLDLTLWGDMDERTRKEMAESIKDDLQADPAISQVTISGVREYEITVEISESKLREYGLTFEHVSRALEQGSVNLAGGSIRTQGEQINIRSVGRKYTGRDIADIVVIGRPNGEIIRMGQLAAIRDGFTEDPIIARFNGHPAVMIALSKTAEEDTIAIARAGYAYVEERNRTLPEGIQLSAWADGSVVLRDRLSITFRNGLIGLCLVVLCLWTFLNTRLSFWVAMGIPISIAGSMTIMWLAGLTLTSVNLFGLVMITGIVVDDAIIVGEAIYLRRRQGDGPLLAATNGLMEVGLPVIAAVLTTVVAFMPLAFVSGIMGQFMSTMAVAVIGALAISLIEALFILPSHLSRLPEANGATKSRWRVARAGARLRKRIDGGMDYVINHLYGRFVRAALRFRYVTLCCGFAVVLFTVGLGRGGYIKFTPFPHWDENQIMAIVEFPQGTSAEVTAAAIERTEQGLRAYARKVEAIDGPGTIEHVFSIVGESGGTNPGDASSRGTHVGMLRVQLQHSDTRTIHSQDVLAGWQREVGDIAGTLSQSFSTVEGGPGGSPIEIWLQGKNEDTLRSAAADIKSKLHSYDGVYQVEDSFRPGKRELKIDVKPEARPLGITLGQLSQQIYAGFYGQEADRIQRGRDDIRIKVRYTDDERSSVAELENIRVRTSQGHEVPFFSVADVEFGAGPATIVRADGRRRISVTAQVDEKRVNAEEVIAEMRATLFPELRERYSGFTISLEGAQQDTRESAGSLMLMFPIAMVGIFVVIAAIFRSYVQPLIIMATVPFGLIGAILGHTVLGWQIVMFSVFGMMALTGVVVNDAIVLIEAINNQIAKGIKVFEAIAQGAQRRFRAILLTTISTVGALFPMIIETDLSAQPLNPMALSLASGVAFATLLTLVYIPCLFAILSDFRCGLHYFFLFKWPARETVEPARHRGAELFPETVDSTSEMSTTIHPAAK